MKAYDKAASKGSSQEHCFPEDLPPFDQGGQDHRCVISRYQMLKGSPSYLAVKGLRDLYFLSSCRPHQLLLRPAQLQDHPLQHQPVRPARSI